jgi:hypothetical protein
MATIVANPYYDDPFLSSIASNISRAFIDRNPGQTAAGRAQARLYGLQADELETKRGSRTKIAAQFRQLNGRAPTPEEYAVMTGDTIEGGLKPDDIASSNLFYTSNSGQSPSIVARSIVGTGKTLNKNEGVTLEDRNELVARDEQTKKSVASIGAGPGYARVAEDRRNNEARLAFDKDNIDSKPVTVNPGDGLFFREGDRRFTGIKSGGVPVEKIDKDKMIAGFDENGQPVWINTQGAAGQRRPPTAAEAKPPPPPRPGDINSPKEVSEAEWNILNKIGAIASDGSIDPDFIAEFGDRIPSALAAIGAPGTNAGSAEATYLKALGIEPGSTWSRGGWFSKPQLKRPAPKPPSPVVGAVTGGAPAPAAPAAPGPRAAPQQSVVPPPANPAERKAGAVYSTPKGMMTWTGTGWVPAGSQ